MNILGISAYYHDSAAALVQDGRIIAAAQEERFTRKKHDPGFPAQAIRYCLEEGGIAPKDLDLVVFYDKPYLKFERLLETYYGFAPRGFQSFRQAIPVWVQEKLFLKRNIQQGLSAIGDWDPKHTRLLFPEHHLSHAASAFYPSPFEESAILTIDGVGEWATASIALGQGKDIRILKELRFPHSLGLLYSAFTYYLGFRVNSGEYKLMGLAPYGNAGSPEVARYVELIRTQLVDVREDGSIWLNQRYFSYATGLRMVLDRKWAQLFGFARREAEGALTQAHCDLALAIQQVTEEVVLLMARTAQALTGSRNLCLAGGVALNCVANGKLEDAGIFDRIFIQPAAGDAGGALGAALAGWHIHQGQARTVQAEDSMQGAYLGPAYSAAVIEDMARRYKAVYWQMSDFAALADDVAGYLAEGMVVGWFQGRMEFGPRALGNRSILGDPRNPEMQKKLNLKIKYRESFRPFAPSVQAERVQEYFETDRISPYMLLVHPVQASRRRPLPPGYAGMDLRDKLYHLRSDIPAVTHIDYSARIQTVHASTNPRYWGLIEAFRQRTGYALLVNTSFNVRGEPIVCTPEDAYKCLMRTEMDVLVVGDYVFHKSEQPAWHEAVDWKTEYGLD
jgi:carbamoyltransferase